MSFHFKPSGTIFIYRSFAIERIKQTEKIITNLFCTFEVTLNSYSILKSNQPREVGDLSTHNPEPQNPLVPQPPLPHRVKSSGLSPTGVLT